MSSGTVRADRHRSGPNRRDRGSTSLELTVLFPALLLLIALAVQAAMYYHARNLALAAAEEGARAGRGLSGTDAGGVRRAREFLTDAGGDVLTGIDVTAAGSTPTAVRIQVSGDVLSLLPGVRLPLIAQEAAGPRERFTSARDRP